MEFLTNSTPNVPAITVRCDICGENKTGVTTLVADGPVAKKTSLQGKTIATRTYKICPSCKLTFNTEVADGVIEGLDAAFDSCTISTWTAPASPTITGITDIAKSVSNATTELKIDITVNTGATWSLHSAASCLAANVIADKTMHLSVGSNVAYIKVTAADNKTTLIYKLTVVRAAS